MLFVDNEETKFSLLKSFSDNASVDKMAEFAELCSEHVTAWIARVPSKRGLVPSTPLRRTLQGVLKGSLGEPEGG